MMAIDTTFVNPDSSIFDAYRSAGLLTNSTTRSDFFQSATNKALKPSALSYSTLQIEHEPNPLGIIRQGPYSNLAGRYFGHLMGLPGYDSLILNQSDFPYGQGFRIAAPPTSESLAKGWADLYDLAG